MFVLSALQLILGHNLPFSSVKYVFTCREGCHGKFPENEDPQHVNYAVLHVVDSSSLTGKPT